MVAINTDVWDDSILGNMPAPWRRKRTLVKRAARRVVSVDEERRTVVARLSRADLIKGSLAVLGAVGGSAVGAAEIAASGKSRGSPATDREILTFGLLIERLQAAFYAAALRRGKLTGEARQFARVVGAEEAAHVKYFADALGPSAGATPRFHFGDSITDPAKFIATAVSLEEAGLGVYNGQAVNRMRVSSRP